MYRNTPENLNFHRGLLQKQLLMLISILLHVLMKKYEIFKYEFLNLFVSDLPYTYHEKNKSRDTTCN